MLADDVVAQALLASRNKVIERALASREARGEARGRAVMVLRLLARRGVSVDEVTLARVLACEDLATLDACFDRAATATRAGEVLGEG